MGIRDLLAAHDARFISLLDLLALFAKHEGVTTQEVARAFSIHGLLKKAPLVLHMARDGDYYESAGHAAWHELESEIEPNRENAPSRDAMYELQDGVSGFFRDEVAAALLSCGFAIPDGLILDAPANPTDAPRRNAPSDELAAEVERLRAELAASAALPEGVIHGKTFAKLAALIEAFPAAYPDPKRTKLDNDIRPWIKRMADASDREAHVFGAILAEHFGLKE